MTFILVPAILKKRLDVIEWEEYKEDCCVVIPVYRKEPVFFEQTSIMQCVRVLGQRRDICFVAPPDLDLKPYTSLCPGYKFRVKRIAKGFSEGIQGYNQLCKRWEFYNMFSDYKYILIYQPDCWVFSDMLDYFIGLDYDYIGAPWIAVIDNQIKPVGCGNGGFSLRKVDKMIEICKNDTRYIENEDIAEDVFFSTKCPGKIKVCPVEVGQEFSFEVGPTLLYELNNHKLPMGCHKPYLFQFKTFWKDYIKF